MAGNDSLDEDQGARSAPRPQTKVNRAPRNSLSHDSYTVAWMCALPLEMAAARAMLDDVHEALPQDVNDSNCYVLGIIGQHNVAIACLPNGNYGTNNAAIVFTNMRRTFTNIQLGLMVGIGGGAPSQADFRLGDIVVGSKVIQHDMGKAMGGGLFNRTSIPRTVPSSINSVVSSLRSKHYSSPSRVPSILRERFEALQGFGRPISADRLFAATYKHESSIRDCTSCDQSKIVERAPRDSNDPIIHYGAIASGNQVIKDSLTRDRLAQDLDVICFEMEAAGMMDICPCLPVRGICDYSDSHKSKEWQRYAAATAASYAREFLEELAVSQRQQQGAWQHQVRLGEKDNECLTDLRITNPQEDKETLIKAKGGLLIESYIWVMENENYQQWARGTESRLLWIKGDPGKGKTMLLCGIINELELATTPDHVFYFFCQASEPRLRSASAVLRGLVWLLARRRPNLISHIREEYDHGGKDVFIGHNALQALSNIMASMLDDKSTNDCIFVIDALDECADDRERLIELVTQFSSSSESKWIVSSRNWPEIEAQLYGVTSNRVHLELNHSSIAEAVQRFITRRVEELAEKKRYTDTTRVAVQEHLRSNANDTFLWVSLVCEELGKPDVFRHHTSEVLRSFPAGLDKLYQRMIQRLLHSRDKDICKAILGVVTIAFEPLSLAELAASDKRLAYFNSDLQTLSTIVTCCGSFLTIRNNIIYTVHQSVKDYLVTSSDIFPSGIAAQHYLTFQSTMHEMQGNLHRNMYSVPDDSLYIFEISKPPHSPLNPLRYGCIYWIEHLLESTSHVVESHSTFLIVETFLKTKYLYWLEAMSLLGCVSEAIGGIKKLGSGLAETVSTAFNDMVEDALRFALTHRAICDVVPLQLYNSALIFSPEGSQVRQNFLTEISSNIRVFSSSFQVWDDYLYNIPYVAKFDSDLKVSPDGQKLAMIRSDDTALILDSHTGQVVKTLKDPYIGSLVGFDAEGNHLATSSGYYSRDNDVTIWNLCAGEAIKTFKNRVDIVVLSEDRMSLALVKQSGLVRVCDPWNGSAKYTVDLRRGEGEIKWIDFGLTKSGAPCLFSIISTRDRVETSTRHLELVVQDPQSGQVIAKRSLATEWSHAALDPDCKRLLIAQQDELQLWDGEVLTHLRCLFAPHDTPSSFGIAWARDGQSFAMATREAVILCDPKRNVRIGRILIPGSISTRLCYVSATVLAFMDLHGLRMLRVSTTSSNATPHYEPIDHLNPGTNGQLESSRRRADNELFITKSDNTLYRLPIPDSFHSFEEGVFSPDRYYAFVDGNGLINIWDTNTCLCLHKLRGHKSDTGSSEIAVQFDYSGYLISANHEDAMIRIWSLATGDCWPAFKQRRWSGDSHMAVSADGRVAILPESEKTLFIRDLWRLGAGASEWTWESEWPWKFVAISISFNSNGLLAVLGSTHLYILDVSLGTFVKTYSFGLSRQNPYARFHAGSDSLVDVGYGVLQLDLERFTDTEERLKEVDSKSGHPIAQPHLWNQHFLRISITGTEAWLMRGSKRVLWIPQSSAASVKMTPNFDTGASMASMVHNSHVLVFDIWGS